MKTETSDEEDTENFDRIMAGLNELVEIGAGRVKPARMFIPPSEVDVRAIRSGTGLSQPAFARRYGFSVGAVRDWEQGRKRPEPTARVLLRVIQREPDAVERALR